MTRPRLIETFNTHRMSAAVIRAVKTARDIELAEAMQAVRQAASQPQQTAQHLIVYGERGSGKSFLLRLVEIEIERLAQDEGLAIVPALLPEEQYNIRAVPQLILAIAAKVRGAGWEAAAFALEFRPLAEAWEAAVADLNAALDQRFGQGLGLVVAMVENFDTLTRGLFGGSVTTQKKSASAKAIEQSAAEQLLRKLMNTQGSRLMLIASATGTVDQDYERPLFQAFKTLDLRIWTSDDCIAYFNRRRALENQPPLSPPEEARARAIAEFIGGNPRLAQLLGEVLASPDARSIASVLDALSDHLADYYRHRLDDLPPQSAALLDALIRKGEPCTQTELAARVGASSQAQIADAFSYLLSSRLLAAGPDKTGAGRLYRLRDRLFVHFYRRRYGSPEQALGLAPIAELLESFFTQREREEHTRRHLEAGEWADARLYALNSLFMGVRSDGFCWYRDSEITGIPSELFQLAGLDAVEAIEAQAELKLHPELSVKRWKDAADNASAGLGRTAACLLEAIALSRCQMDNEAEAALQETLRMAETSGDIDAQILVLDQLAKFAYNRRKDQAMALDLSARSGALAEQSHDNYLKALALYNKLWNLSAVENAHYVEAIVAADEALALASRIDSLGLQDRLLRGKAYNLIQLKRYEEAAQTGVQAADLAAASGAVYVQVEALGFVGSALAQLGQHDAAEAAYGKAAQLAGSIGDLKEQSRLLLKQSICLLNMKRPEQALSIARDAANLAQQLGDLGNRAHAVSIAGYALNGLGQYAEAASLQEEAAQLAASAGDIAMQLESLNYRVWSLSLLKQHEAALELAQTVCGLANQPEYAYAQSDAYRLQGWSLAKLQRTDEATAAFAEAFRIAESARLKQQFIKILEGQTNCLGQQQPAQTLAFARVILVDKDTLPLAAPPVWTAEELSTARRIFFAAAARTEAPDLVQVLEACLSETFGEENQPSRAFVIGTVLTAVAYNSLWDEFAACLLRHPQVLPLLSDSSAFEAVGRVWAEQAKANGRAQTYAAIARHLPAIVRVTELLPYDGRLKTWDTARRATGSPLLESPPVTVRDQHGGRVEPSPNYLTRPASHLRSLINGLVNHCDDAGFLQDLAGLLTEGFGEPAEAEIQRLLVFAEVHAAPDKEKVLQRLDPDLAIAIRRILDLPEPDDLLAQKGRRKGR